MWVSIGIPFTGIRVGSSGRSIPLVDNKTTAMGCGAMLVGLPGGIILYLAIQHWVITLCVLPAVVLFALAGYCLARPKSRVAKWFAKHTS
ncbi:MAG: hypothetical protein QOC75_4995 [Pseudonocardiales bacterium]|jgi:hypothetical protein|nr:hypothetical protein [Pseudonocardiales bacterium]